MAKKKSKLFSVSQSKVNSWLLCKAKYHFKYVDGLRAKVKARPLKFGGIVHDMLEAEAEDKDPFKALDKIAKTQGKLFREEEELYGDIIGDTRYIMDAYFDYWKKDPLIYIKHDGRYSEHDFALEVDGIEVKGRIDAFAKSRKMKWLVENKSHKNFPNDDHRWRNLQSSIYTRIVEMLGWFELDGTLWNYIRSKPPTRPQLLKDGSLSTRSLDSLPNVVLDVIREHKLDAKKYKPLVDSQRANMSNYFQRVYTPVKKKVVDFMFGEFIDTAHEMEALHGKVRRMTIGRHCDWCEFEAICRARLQGSDVDFVIEHEFTTRPEIEDEEQED